MILELTREIRLGWNVQHEGKRFSVARISWIGVSSRNKKFCTARQQTNREFVNGLNSHYDPHRNFFRQRINDLQRGRCIARARQQDPLLQPATHLFPWLPQRPPLPTRSTHRFPWQVAGDRAAVPSSLTGN